MDREPAERTETDVGVDRGDQRVETPTERRVAEVVAAGTVACGGEHGLGVETDVERRSVLECGALGRIQMRAGEVGNDDRVVHGTSRRSRRFWAPRTSPSNQRISQKFACAWSARSRSWAPR